MLLFIQILKWTTRFAGLGAITLGLLHWIFRISLLEFHWLFGFTVTLALLVVSIVAVFNSRTRVLGIIGILFAPIIPLFGFSQMTILVGDLHWLIQVAHLLVGVAALALIERTSSQYKQYKQAVPARVS